jgi:hypothetical protein
VTAGTVDEPETKPGLVDLRRLILPNARPEWLDRVLLTTVAPHPTHPPTNRRTTTMRPFVRFMSSSTGRLARVAAAVALIADGAVMARDSLFWQSNGQDEALTRSFVAPPTGFEPVLPP